MQFAPIDDTEMPHLPKTPLSISKAEKWLELAYELFARDGVNAIKVERLAHLLNLNKSGFYHYFGDRQQFMSELFRYHIRVARQMALEIPGCQKIDPDFFLLVVKYKECLLFQGQLLRTSNHRNNGAIFLEVTGILDRPFLPLWSKYIHRENNAETALKYFNLFRDSFYARANYDNISYLFLHDLLTESEAVIRAMFTNTTTNQPKAALPRHNEYQ